jgi:hypothetical protein
MLVGETEIVDYYSAKLTYEVRYLWPLMKATTKSPKWVRVI